MEEKVILGGRKCTLRPDAIQRGLDMISDDINRLRNRGHLLHDGAVFEQYNQIVGAINLLNHMTGYVVDPADARAEAAIALRKSIKNHNARRLA